MAGSPCQGVQAQGIRFTELTATPRRLSLLRTSLPSTRPTCKNGLTSDRPETSFYLGISISMSAISRATLHQSPHARFSRALAYALLILVGYASSIGTAHRHNGLSKTPQSVVSVATDSPAVVDLGQSSDGPFKPGECQICQFRQSLSNGTIYVAVLRQAPIDSSPVVTVLAVSVSSTAQTASQGRAPPITS